MSQQIGADLPETFPSDLELRLQDRSTFELLHRMGETNNYLFALGHKTIGLAAEPSIDNAWLTEAIMRGVETYEIVAAMVSPESYSDPEKRPAVVNCTFEFIGDIKKPDDFFVKAEYAETRLRNDAPRMTEVLEEVTSRHLDHDKVATRFALRGAAVMRAMQIYVDKRLVA